MRGVLYPQHGQDFTNKHLIQFFIELLKDGVIVAVHALCPRRCVLAARPN